MKKARLTRESEQKAAWSNQKKMLWGLLIALDLHYISAPQGWDHLKVLAFKTRLLAVPVMIQSQHVTPSRCSPAVSVCSHD